METYQPWTSTTHRDSGFDLDGVLDLREAVRRDGFISPGNFTESGDKWVGKIKRPKPVVRHRPRQLRVPDPKP